MRCGAVNKAVTHEGVGTRPTHFATYGLDRYFASNTTS